MSYISTAIGAERIARTSGYKIKKGSFQEGSSNLPQMIAVFGEANRENQGSISTDRREITSAEEAGRIYGYGSPIHQIMRILRPTGSDGVGGIPTVVFPQLEVEDATAQIKTITVSGTPTSNGTHTIVIAGRENLDFQSYSFSVNSNDTLTGVRNKIIDAVNNVLSSPVIASAGVASGELILTSKWAGETAGQIQVSLNTNGNPVGLTYALNTTGAAAGRQEDILTSLQQFGNDWFTCVINPYRHLMSIFAQYNGTPAVEYPEGRYSPTIFKPFMVFNGANEDTKGKYLMIKENNNLQENDVTNVVCPAPVSPAFEWEAAANVVRLFARTMQDTPESDINGMTYPDMPIPANLDISDMAEYNNRDLLVKNGVSTVVLNKGAYEVQDLVTVYQSEGEKPLQFNYCRNLNLDWNIADAYRIIEILKLRDKVLVLDNQVTSSTKAIKPKEWKAILYSLFEDLAERALIKDPSFSKGSLLVGINNDNPNRFDTFFRYQRTGIARIESTTVEAGF